jgi:DNA-binding response OmpR family regulator
LNAYFCSHKFVYSFWQKKWQIVKGNLDKDLEKNNIWGHMKKILLIDDAIEIYQIIEKHLAGTYALQWAKTYREALVALEGRDFDMILLDVVLPDGDGFHLCSMIQTNPQLQQIPLFFLTGKNAIGDKVLGFQIGADDYITKPFDPLELKIRIESKMKRAEQMKSEQTVLRFGNLEIQKKYQQAYFVEREQRTPIALTPIEFKILLLLSSDPNQLFEREKVIEYVWGKGVYVNSRSVDTHVSKLRKKLEAFGDHIQAVRGKGYIFRFQEENHAGLSSLPHTLHGVL